MRGTITGGAAGTSDVLRCALFAAQLGWPVFPLRPGGKVPAIRAAHPAGHPCRGECGRHGHGFHDATTDPDVIRAWWRSMPAANYGIATGPLPLPIPSGGGGVDLVGVELVGVELVVVDLDVPKLSGPHGRPVAGPVRRPPLVLPDQDADVVAPATAGDGAGVLAWAATLDGARLDLAGTFTIVTPSGGRHLYYALPHSGDRPVVVSSVGMSGGRVTGLGWLIDVRAAGGYVVGPGSVTDVGAYVRAPEATAGPGEPPGWLRRRLAAHAAHAHADAAPGLAGHRIGAVGRAERPCMAGEAFGPGSGGRRPVSGYAAAAVAGELAHIAAAVAGDTAGAGRNATLNRAAYKLGRLVDAAGLDPAQLVARLVAAGVAVGLSEREAATAVASGLAHGRSRPRRLPPPRPT